MTPTTEAMPLSVSTPRRSYAARLRRVGVIATLALGAQTAALVTLPAASAATTFTVTSAADTTDGVCDADCTLREAITAANGAAGTDTIAFSIPGPTPVAIAVTSALPTITGQVVIDGSTQPGFAGTPVVQIDGTGAGATTNGLTVQAASSEIRNLSVTGFGRDGIDIAGAAGVVVSGNHLGVDPAGTAGAGNGRNGLTLNLANNATVDDNVISGNGSLGVYVGASNVAITDNRIGTDVTGAAAIPNGTGIQVIGGAVASNDNTIGGPAAGNVISGNIGDGILLNVFTPDRVRNTRIEGNLIGVAADGVSPLGNGRDGVNVFSGSGLGDNVIGGTGAGQGNIIAFNAVTGVAVGSSSSRDAVLGNSIHSNGGLGIDLGRDGLVNAAANNGQMPPVITAAAVNGAVDGTVEGPVSSSVRVEFFASAACDSSGSGEGETFIGFADVATDVAGDGIFSAPVGAGIGSGDFVTATATDADGNTSEFSPCAIPSPGDPTLMVTSTDDVDDGTCDLAHCSLREAIIAANAAPGPDDIRFDLGGTAPQTISPTAALPVVTGPVSIDGGTAADCAGVPGVVLGGSLAGAGAAGLHLGGGDSTVRGLVVSDWAGSGIDIQSHGNTVQCSYIGTDATGTVDAGNQRGVFIVNGNDNLIGGTGAGQGNLISANTFQGVAVSGVAVTGNRVEGNLVGTDVTGTAALGNKAFGGVNIGGTGNTVGGADPAARNIISGNVGDGIFFPNNSTNHLIQGNWIGVDITGNVGLANGANGVLFNGVPASDTSGTVVRDNVISGNGNSGVQLSGPFAFGNTIEDNLIGVGADGTTALRNGPPSPAPADSGWGVLSTGPDNIIRGNVVANTGTAIQIGTSPSATGITGVTISENDIGPNVTTPIDLGGDGATANDPGDADDGPNTLLNHPVIEEATETGGATTVTGTVEGAPLATVHVELFASAECAPATTANAVTFLQSVDVEIDESGVGYFEEPVGPSPVSIVATATDEAGNTSEFSACAPVVAVGPEPATDRIAYASNVAGTYDIWTIDPDGGNAVPVTTGAGTENYPTWSPDGTRIAYTDDGTIRIINHDGSGTPFTVYSSGPSASFLDWSPDGTRLAFSANAGASGFDVWVIDVDGTDLTNLTDTYELSGSPSQEGQPAWSPDGTQLAIKRTSASVSDLWLLDPDAPASPTQLTTDGGNKTSIRWLPSGGALTFNLDGLKRLDTTTLAVTNLSGDVGTRGMSWNSDASRLTFAGPMGGLLVRTLAPLSQTTIVATTETVFNPDWHQAPGTEPVGILPSGAAVLEGDTGSQTVLVPVTLSAPAPQTVTVDWSTVDIPTNPLVARSGSDHVAASGTLSFAPGETVQYVPIDVLGDIVDEPPAYLGEWGLIQFSNPSANAVVDTSGLFGLGLFIIVDDDPTPSITPGLGIVEEGDAGTVTVEVPVTLSNPSAVPITVDWATLDTGGAGIATATLDYVADSGTVTFAPGETAATVTITVLGDTIDEPPALYGEWGLVAFSNPTNATIDTSFFGIGLFIILDDDPAGGCTIDSTAVATLLAQTECDALIALYDSTNGPGWTTRTGWSTPTDPCTWYGVTCTGSTVTRLTLDDNQLSGPIPAVLADLANLTHLSLRENQLSGPIPTEVSTLADLTYLSLYANPLSGSIPPELGDLTSLQTLLLYSTQLSGPIPAELGDLANLVTLNLSQNQLSGPIPAELGNLVDVEILWLAGNQLTGTVPAALGDLTSLRRLYLHANQFTGALPAELGNLSLLTHLYAHQNLLTGDITAAMSGLQDTVTTLDLSDGAAGNDCLTVTDGALAAWLAGIDPGWDACDP